MSNRQSSWMSSSVSRPTAFNSPTFSRLSDIKGRLSFSAMKTPAFKPKQRSLVDHARNSASSLNGYHMSKQNPDVLDHLCSPSPSHRDHLLHKKTLTPATVRVGGGGGGVLIGTRNGHSTAQSSLVKQMLNDKHRAPASLVHLATRGKSFRSSVHISPVVVKLSGAAPQSLPTSTSSSLNSSREENRTPENGGEGSSRDSDGEASSGKNIDPCDKNVVLSALRQRRKRWATSAPDDDNGLPSSGSPFSGAPSAKRSKHSSHGSESHKSPLSFITGDRKRAYTAPSYSMSPDSKKSRFSANSGEQAMPSTLGKVTHPEFEIDRGSEVSELSEAEQESGISSKTSSRAPSECIGSFDGDSLQGRSLTPPIQFDEAEINRKREESLNSLKAVFSPKGSEKKTSNRRKLPIFCATGTKPHLPTPLSTSHSVTQEDLKKDREAAAAKLREILTAEEEPALNSVSTSSLPAQVTPLSNASSSKDVPLNPVSGLRLSSTLSGSLPSLPSASFTTKTSLSSTGVASNLSLTVPPSTVTSTSAPSAGITSSTLQVGASLAPSTVTTSSAVQQTQVKSVSFAPLPVPSPASTTQAGFSFQPLATVGSQPPATNQHAITNTSTSSSIYTGSQLPQFAVSLSNTAPTVSATSNTLTIGNANTTTQVSKAPGLGLGQTFTQQQSTGFSLPVGSSNQLGLFQNPTVATSTSTSVPSAGTTAPTQPGGILFGAVNSTVAAPSTTALSGGFKFALPPTTQQPLQQSTGLSLPSTKPSLSIASSSAAPGSSSIFGLNSGVQATASNPQPSSNGTSGIVFGVPSQQQQQQLPQQQQTSQLSLFGGAQKPQSSSSGGGGGGISFSFAQQPSAIGGGGMATSGSTSLNFAAGSQQSQATVATGGGGLKTSNFTFSTGLGNNAPQSTSGLNFPGASQSSGGLSLFNSAGNSQQQQQLQQQKTSQLSSIFSSGSGSTNVLQANQSNATSGLFNSQQHKQTATGFTGFKLDSNTNGGSQAQATQNLSLFGNTKSTTANPLTGGSSGGLNLTVGGVGGSSGFPSFNAGGTGGGSSGFSFSAGPANIGGVGGMFQKVSATPAQLGNPLTTASAGNQQAKSGMSFNFSAGALAPQQQSQLQQSRGGGGGGGPFAFGQNPNSTGGINFAANSGSTGIGIGNAAQNGFNFSTSAGMGMNTGVKSTSGVFNNNSSSNVFQSPLQPQQSTNVFQTPQTQKQLSFTGTPTNQPSTPAQGVINFQGNSSISFTAGTPGGSASRPVARARRRKK